jgi:oligopeptide/dipeptide ABC transporter ATP-binding protein
MPDDATAPMLETRGLGKVFHARGHMVAAVQDVSLRIRRGEVFGLVGESGCGKSTFARMLVRLLQPTSGSILLEGQDVGAIRGDALRRLRRTIQMVFQDPYSSLNPSFRTRDILWEGLSKLGRPRRATREAMLAELIERVGLSRHYLDAYPHELSGGQRQRVGIARALSVAPKLLVADEPTSALDVSVQAQILDLFIDLQQSLDLTILFVSHDLGVIRYLCDRVAVMYLGRIVEQGPAADVLVRPRHPYTAGLIASMPQLDQRAGRGRSILPGDLPNPFAVPTGCAFHPRCDRAQDHCRMERPFLDDDAVDHRVACFHPRNDGRLKSG